MGQSLDKQSCQHQLTLAKVLQVQCTASETATRLQ